MRVSVQPRKLTLLRTIGVGGQWEWKATGHPRNKAFCIMRLKPPFPEQRPSNSERSISLPKDTQQIWVRAERNNFQSCECETVALLPHRTTRCRLGGKGYLDSSS